MGGLRGDLSYVAGVGEGKEGHVYNIDYCVCCHSVFFVWTKKEKEKNQKNLF